MKNKSCSIYSSACLDFRYQWLSPIQIGARTFCFVLLSSLFLTLFFSTSLFAAPPGPQEEPPPLVTVAAVTTQDVNPPTEYVGHVEAIQTVDLRARVQGFLEQVNFKEGNFVHAGDMLYVIEQAPYQARVNVNKARVDQAKAALTYAGQHLQRLRAADAKSIPATDIDNAVAAELQAKAQLEEAQANLALSELDLDYTTIKAPISGRIGRTAYTKGNLVGPTSVPLARIVQLDPIRVVYSISENDLATIQMALKDSSQESKNPILVPRIRLSNGEIYKTAGYVDFVNNEVDSSTGTIAVWAVFDNRDGMLTSGQYVTALLEQSKPEILPVVLQSAVQEDRQGRYVLIVDTDNRVAQRRVKTGPLIGIWWAVESGLTEGERVIVQGVQKVRPGQLVKTITENEQKER